MPRVADAYIRAAAARALIEDPAFTEVINEIRDDAVSAFLKTSATPADLEAAHQKVRAIETIMAALQSRLNDEAVQQRKDHHRGNE